jgi:hypothetical protein
MDTPTPTVKTFADASVIFKIKALVLRLRNGCRD